MKLVDITSPQWVYFPLIHTTQFGPVNIILIVQKGDTFEHGELVIRKLGWERAN